MAGLLYPAYQKYYSALRSLQSFNIESDFFDNVASLDSFLSEYRSTTLVLQTSIAHTQYKRTYDKFPKGSWDPFFNEQRVKSIHKHPIEFTKIVKVDLYFPDREITLVEKEFSIEDDQPLTELINEMRETFEQLGLPEVFFSAHFSFKEIESGQDIWDKLFDGLLTMKNFMDYMYSEIGEACPLCEKLRESIKLIDPTHLPGDFVTTMDYVYYPRCSKFERADRCAVILGNDGNGAARMPISQFASELNFGEYNTSFEKFILIHLPIASGNMMPVIMTVYDDDTFTLDVFQSSIKTTFYRKINEKAKEVLADDVREVILMAVYSTTDANSIDILNSTAQERAATAQEESLVFFRAGIDLQEYEVCFDLRYIRCPGYVIPKLNDIGAGREGIAARNMSPIVNAFRCVCSRS